MLRGATRMHAAGPAAPDARGGVWSCLPLRRVRAGAPPSMSSGVRLYNGAHGLRAVRPGPGRHRAAAGPGAPGPVRACGGRRGEVSRNQAAEAVGVQRGLAAFHLDKLVEAGLLEASFRRLGGPGPAGRPSSTGGRPARSRPASSADLRDRRPPAGRDRRAGRGRPGAQAAARRAGREAGRRLAEEAEGPGPAIGPVLGPGATSPSATGPGCACATARSPAWPASSRWWSAP